MSLGRRLFSPFKKISAVSFQIELGNQMKKIIKGCKYDTDSESSRFSLFLGDSSTPITMGSSIKFNGLDDAFREHER